MSQTIFNTNLRLNLENEDERRALSYLQNMDRKQYKSYTQAIVAAVNSYFGQQEESSPGTFLESRDKEDAFFRRMEETIIRCLHTAPEKNCPRAARQTPLETVSVERTEKDEMDAVARAFVNGL